MFWSSSIRLKISVGCRIMGMTFDFTLPCQFSCRISFHHRSIVASLFFFMSEIAVVSVTANAESGSYVELHNLLLKQMWDIQYTWSAPSDVIFFSRHFTRDIEDARRHIIRTDILSCLLVASRRGHSDSWRTLWMRLTVTGLSAAADRANETDANWMRRYRRLQLGRLPQWRRRYSYTRQSLRYLHAILTTVLVADPLPTDWRTSSDPLAIIHLFSSLTAEYRGCRLPAVSCLSTRPLYTTGCYIKQCHRKTDISTMVWSDSEWPWMTLKGWTNI